MAEVSPPSATGRPKFRAIGPDDLAAAAQLLDEGFPGHEPPFWPKVLRRLLDRDVNAVVDRHPGLTPVGQLLTVDDVPQGIILAIPSTRPPATEDDGRVVVNLSSWYVRPELRASGAVPLYRHASAVPGVTYTNLSPSEHILEMVRLLRWTEWTSGQMLAVAPRRAAGRRRGRARPLNVDQARRAGARDADVALVEDHERLGCLAFFVEREGALVPMVFLRRRIKGVFPCAHVLYAPRADIIEEEGAALLGALWRRGVAGMIVDAAGPLSGYVGRWFPGRVIRFYKGPAPAAWIDYAYSEMVFVPALS